MITRITHYLFSINIFLYYYYNFTILIRITKNKILFQRDQRKIENNLFYNNNNRMY